MANIASLAVQFTARTGNLIKGISKSSKGIGRFAKNVAGAAVKMAKFGAVLITAGAGALTFFIKKQFAAIDSIAKFATSMEVSIGALEGYKLAARITGASNELIIKSMQTLQKRMGEVAQGFGEGQRALDALGIEFTDISKLTLEGQLETIADGMKNLATRSEQAAVANQLFGRGGKDLLIFLDQGSAGIRGFIEEAKELGLSFSAVDARKVEDANDAIVRLKSALTGVVRGLAVFVAPVIERLATMIKDTIIGARQSAVTSFTEMKEGIVTRIKEIIKVGLPILILFVRRAIAEFQFWAKVVFSIVTAIAKAVIGFFKFINQFSNVRFGIGLIDSLKELMLLQQFVFKNMKKSIDVAVDFAVLKFSEFRDGVIRIFAQIGLTVLELGDKVVSIFKGIVRLAEFNIMELITGEGDLEKLEQIFEDITKPLTRIEPIVSKGTEFARTQFDHTLAGFSNSFAKFRKNELEGAGDLTQKFLDFFKFKLPKLDLTESATSTIQAFGQDKTLQALERGSAEALKVERQTQGAVEKNTEEMVNEQKETNILLRRAILVGGDPNADDTIEIG